MRRVIVISLAGIALSGCASFSSVPGLGFLTPTPPSATLQLESQPPGAEARTSAGPSCRTPCSVSVPVGPLSVTFTLDRFQPQTVAVQPSETVSTELEPNPVFAQLAPAAPPKRTAKRPPKRAAKRPAAQAAPPAEASPFPPASSSPFPSR